MQASVDQGMRNRWEVAKDAKEKREVFIAACGKALNDLDQVINRATDDLRRRAERHESLSLGGSFAAQVSSAVGLLELRYAALREKKDVGPGQLKTVQTSLDCMKRRLPILQTAEEDMRKPIFPISL